MLFDKKRLFSWCLTLFAWMVVGAMTPSVVQAAIVFDGSVSPTDSADWEASTDGYIGTSGGSGTALIDNASGLNCRSGYIGEDTSGTVTVDGAGSTWTMNPEWVQVNPWFGRWEHGDLFVGVGTGSGILKISNGGAVSNRNGYITMSSGATGTVELTDNSTWTNTEALYVGNDGEGVLDVLSGSSVTCVGLGIGNDSGAAGTVTVDGAGSLLENNGDALIIRDGKLNITGGGLVQAAYEANVEPGMGAIHFNTGTLEVGTTLYATSTDLTGTGVINAHGMVGDQSLTFDGVTAGVGTFGTAGTVTVDMSSGQGDLGVGYGATTGVLTIQNAAALSSANGYLGYNAGSAGTASISGAAVWDCSNMYVGLKGTGVLDITGGTVSNTYGHVGYSSGATGTVNVDGNGSTWKAEAGLDFMMQPYGGDLVVGGSGTGTLSISNGGCVSADGKTQVGLGIGSTGTIQFNTGTLTTQSLYAKASQLTGTGSVVANGLVSDMNLTFDATHGASQTFMVPGSNVSMTLDMSDSSAQGDLGVGYQSGSSASLLITDGVAVGYSGAGSEGFVGYRSGSSGTAIVSGSARWNCDTLYVGYEGNGTLNINGGTVNSVYGTIADKSNGTATVDGSNSMWNVDILKVGRYGDVGWLCIYNGGVVSGEEATVGTGGYGAGAGILRVNGAGSTFSAQSLTLGDDSGQGTLEVQNGGVAEIGGRIDLGRGFMGMGSSVGNIYCNGGTLRYTGTTSQTDWISVADCDGNVYIEADGVTFDITNAVDVSISMTLKAEPYSPGGGLTKTGAGTLILSGANTYTGLTAVNGGTLKLMDMSSNWIGAFKSIFTGGSASLAGGALLFNYSDTYGDAAALSDIQDAIADGKIFAADYTPPLLCSGNSATDIVTVMNTLYGDANVDGSVNGTDLNAVLSNYNQSGQVWANGDFNFDGSVNGTDLNTVLSNYNQSVSFASTAAVPEPSTLLLLVMGLVGLLVWRRK